MECKESIYKARQLLGKVMQLCRVKQQICDITTVFPEWNYEIEAGMESHLDSQDRWRLGHSFQNKIYPLKKFLQKLASMPKT